MGILTRKDFVKFALELAKMDNDTYREEIMKSQINIFKDTNPRFDEARFRKFVKDKVMERKLGF